MILAALYIRVVAPPLAVPDSYRRLPYPVPSSPSRLPPVSHRFRKLSSGFITKEWPVDPKCGGARYATCAIFLRGILVAWSGCQRGLGRSPGPSHPLQPHQSGESLGVHWRDCRGRCHEAAPRWGVRGMRFSGLPGGPRVPRRRDPEWPRNADSSKTRWAPPTHREFSTLASKRRPPSAVYHFP